MTLAAWWLSRHTSDPLKAPGPHPTLMNAAWDVPRWVAPDGLAWWEDGGLFVPVGDHIAAMPLAGPISAWSDPSSFVAWGADGAVVLHHGALSIYRESLAGVSRRVRPDGPWWRADGLDLDEGPRRCRRLLPWPLGDGLAWQDLGWLYRQALGGAGRSATSVAGTLHHEETFAVGPHGALLTGDDTEWTRVAAPGRPLVRLAEAFSAHGLRWSADGLMVAGEQEGTTVCCDARTGEVKDRRPGLPISADASWEAETGTVHGTLPYPWPDRSTPTCTDGRRIGGPGRRIWSPSRAATEPILRGPTAANRKRWATVDHHGAGCWIDPASGACGPEFEVPLRAADAVIAQGIRGDEASFLTASGRMWRVRGAKVGRGEDAPASWAPDEAPQALRAIGLGGLIDLDGPIGWVSPGGTLVMAPGPVVLPP